MDLTKPIPLWTDLAGGAAAIKPYGIEIGYDFDHPQWQEPLVDLSEMGLLTKSWYAVTDGSNPPYNKRIEGSIDRVLLRKKAASMCLQADQRAQAQGFRLLFVDGFRSSEAQTGIYKHFEAIIKERKPHLTPDELRKETLVYVTPGELDPNDPATWFVHATGGSIDVLLYNEAKGEIVDCGVGFDNDTPAVFTDHYERHAPETAACLNRRILYNTMIQAGFTNYPYEYFHYDFGTILYAVRQRLANPASKTQAFYGLAQLLPR